MIIPIDIIYSDINSKLISARNFKPNSGCCHNDSQGISLVTIYNVTLLITARQATHALLT